MSEIVPGVVKNKYDTAANLSAANDTPLAGELTIESDTGLFKFGDGITAYNTLPCANAGIGEIRQFSTQATRTGYFEFELNNSVSQSTYSALFAEIGHKYNDLHVLAGDTDLSGSGTLFYPTPPPTENGYLKVYEDWANTTNTVTLVQLDGQYKVTYVNGGSTGNQYTAELTLDSVGGVTTPIVVNGSLNLDARVQYTYATGVWSCVAEATFDIVKIEKLVPETLSTDGMYGYIKY